MKNDIPAQQLRWQFWVDRGGTFTDIVARRPDGKLVTHKLLSEYPERYDDAVTQGMREMLGLKTGDPLPAEQIEVIKICLLYTSPSPRDATLSRMPSSA